MRDSDVDPDADAFPQAFKPASAFDRSDFLRALANPMVCVVVAEDRSGRVVGYVYGEILESPETPIAYARKDVYVAHLELDSYAFDGRALAADWRFEPSELKPLVSAAKLRLF